MTLDFLKKAKDTSSFPLIFVWGPPNVGKTVFALTCPPPILFIDIERKSIEYSRRQVTEHQNTDFTLLEYSDPQDLISKLNQMDDAGVLEDGTFKTVVIDSGTRVWSDVQNDYEEEKKLSRDNDGMEALFANATQLLEWKTIKGPLRRIMTKIRNSPMVRVITAHEADVFDPNTKKVIGKTFKMEKTITYDANIELRLFVENGVHKAEILRDNTNAHGNKRVVENPHYGMWAPFYENGGKNSRARKSLPTPPATTESLAPEINEAALAACFADQEIVGLLGILGLNETAARKSFIYYNYDIEKIKEVLNNKVGG